MCSDRCENPTPSLWLGRPLVFSFDPRRHGLCGSQKQTSIFGRQRKATMIGKFLSPVPGQGLIQLLW